MSNATFRDIYVAPAQRFSTTLHTMAGGPSWPGWEKRTFERQCRGGRPVDEAPTHSGEAARASWPNAFWGGMVVRHFGHQIAEFSLRILPSRFASPGARLVFAPMGGGPPWFGALLDWCELPEEHRIFIDRPLQVAQLTVVAQAEQLNGVGPDPAHLDLMDRFIQAKPDLPKRDRRTVFVSRAGLQPNRARFAGEAYIEDCARRAGALVIRPEQLLLHEQMRTYMGSTHLVFSEGSALHLLQLAGRQFGDVTVLGRRPKDNFISFVAPRTTRYRHAATCAHLVHGLRPDGPPSYADGITIPDVPEMFDAFGHAGADIRSHFDFRAFARVMTDDLMNWLAVETGPREARNWRDSDREVARTLEAAGVPSLARHVLNGLARAKETE